MEKAYVLISCEIGTENELFLKLNEFNQVKKVTVTYGEYDLVVEIETETSSQLDDFITTQIRKLAKIRTTITLRVTD